MKDRAWENEGSERGTKELKDTEDLGKLRREKGKKRCYRKEKFTEKRWSTFKFTIIFGNKKPWENQNLPHFALSFLTRYEQAYLTSLVGLRPENYFWIGLSDMEKQGTFKWTSGEAVLFTHWNSAMPGTLYYVKFLYLESVFKKLTFEIPMWLQSLAILKNFCRG